MLCMVNFARAQPARASLEATTALAESARDKARDILDCDSFSHTACGREFTYWMRETGYISAACWRVGENLAWGTGEYGTVRSIFRAWMRSPEHRANILGDFSQTGIDLRTGTLGGNRRDQRLDPALRLALRRPVPSLERASRARAAAAPAPAAGQRPGRPAR